MNFFFDRLQMECVKIDERVHFRSVSLTWMNPPIIDLCSLLLSCDDMTVLFVFQVNQELVADQIKAMLPKWSNVNIYTKGCCPLFLFIQKGEIVAEVNGCDSPEVMRQIFEYMPPVPADKKEEA
jgi:hypothetical protein